MIQLLGSRVLIRPEGLKDGEKVTSSGIIIPPVGNRKEAPSMGEVVAVGPHALELKAGQRVVFSKYEFDLVKLDDEELSIGELGHVLAILE